jgi:iron complex outermembrane recepter protein
LAWSLSAFSVNLHEIIYGPSTEWQSDLGDSPTGTPIYYNNRIGTIPITNLELGLTALKGLKFAVGANNLFNRYPEKLNGNLTSTFNAVDDNAAVQKYPGFSPFGIDGGFYYAKVSFRF